MGGGEQTDHLLCILPWNENGNEQVQKALQHIRQQFPHLRITYRYLGRGHSPSEIPKEIYHDVTILATISVLPPSKKDCPKLEFIQFFSAGINHIVDTPIYRDTDIPLTTSSGIHGPQISEWVLMTLLAHNHQQKLLLQWQENHVWPGGNAARSLASVADLVGKRLGVLGYGSIGRQAARVCKAIGMDVIAYTASPRTTPESKKDNGFIVPDTGDPDGVIPSAWYSGLDKPSLHNFLNQEIDVLLVSVPLTAQTQHFLGQEEFEILGRCPHHAFISNISRGAIIDQNALIDALKAVPSSASVYQGGSVSNASPLTASFGEIAKEENASHNKPSTYLSGAALDVTDPEPLPSGHPLWDLPNIQITPHISGTGAAYVSRAFAVLEANLERRAHGEKLINVVQRQRGY